MSQQFIDRNELKEIINTLNLTGDKVCELGGNLVLSEYRGQGIIISLMKIKIELAKELEFDYMITTIHPDNIVSLKSIEKVGLRYIKTTTLNRYLRDI